MSASIAAGPALKTRVSSRPPSAREKVPSATPTSACACVTFGKYPSRSFAPAAGAPPREQARRAASAIDGAMRKVDTWSLRAVGSDRFHEPPAAADPQLEEPEED